MNIIYLKLAKDVEVHKKKVSLSDIARVYCKSQNILNKCKGLQVIEFISDKKDKKVISSMKIIQLLEEKFTDILVENIGEKDTLIEYIGEKQEEKTSKLLKIIFVCLISFFGTSFSIMAFHNDIGIERMFDKIHALITGYGSNGFTPLEISYSIGLSVGMIVFFNHIGGRRITSDPTPIEVEMRNYERDVNDALIETADRQKEEIDVK